LQAILWAGVAERHLNGHFAVVLALSLFVRPVFKQQREGVAVGNVVKAEAAYQAVKIAGVNRLAEELLFFAPEQDALQQVERATVDLAKIARLLHKAAPLHVFHADNPDVVRVVGMIVKGGFNQVDQRFDGGIPARLSAFSLARIWV
jgi:hypothetical protein